MKRQRRDGKEGEGSDPRDQQSDCSDDDALIESIYQSCVAAVAAGSDHDDDDDEDIVASAFQRGGSKGDSDDAVMEEDSESGSEDSGSDESVKVATTSIPQAKYGDETAVDGLKRLDIEYWPHRILVGGKQAEKYGDFIICSEESVKQLSKNSWHWIEDGYVRWDMRQEDGTIRNMSMSRYLLATPQGLIADHVDTNKWDHRLESLANVTHRQSAQNKAKRPGLTSDFLGVKEEGKNYVASISVDGTQLRLGSFPTQEEAAHAYDTFLAQNKETKKLGQRLNFPDKKAYYIALSPFVIAAKKPTKTGYSYVTQDWNKFRSNMVVAGKSHFMAGFNTAEDAARAADRLIVKNGWNKKLNFPDEHPGYVPTPKVNYAMMEITKDDHILSILADIGVPFKSVDPDIDCLIDMGKKHGYTLLQKADFESIYTLHLFVDDGYVQLRTKSPVKKMGLNRYLFQPLEEGILVDHTKSNKRDNRRRFLNPTTHKGNNDNSKKKRRDGNSDSDYIGVSKADAKWRACIYSTRKRIFDRCYADEVDAARSRDLFVRAKNLSSRPNFEDWDDPAVLAYWTKKLNSNNELF